MITCEQFERSFRTWKEGNLGSGEEEEMRRHAAACAFCASYDTETSRLKDLLIQVPLRDTSPGFDFQLQRRIREAVKGGGLRRKPQASLLPRWAAWGAGLATGVVVGLAILLPSGNLDNSGSQIAESDATPPAQTEQTLAAAPDTACDSSSVPDDPYRMDEHSQTVSSSDQ